MKPRTLLQNFGVQTNTIISCPFEVINSLKKFPQYHLHSLTFILSYISSNLLHIIKPSEHMKMLIKMLKVKPSHNNIGCRSTILIDTPLSQFTSSKSQFHERRAEYRETK